MAELIFTGMVRDVPGQVTVTVAQGKARWQKTFATLAEATVALAPLHPGIHPGKLESVFGARPKDSAGEDYLVHYACTTGEIDGQTLLERQFTFRPGS